MIASNNFDVTPAVGGLTLVAALRAWLPEASWSDVRKLVRARRVAVNHALCLDEGRRLEIGEAVEIAAAPHAPPPRDEDVKVQYLDEQLVVVEKPAGMTTLRHAAQRDWPAARKALQPTLDEATARIIARIENAKPGHARHGRTRHSHSGRLRSVHRLDRETSGLLVFARTTFTEAGLVEQFAAHSTTRVYQAVVAGFPRQRKFESYLVRDRGDGLRGSVPQQDETGKQDPPEGKWAVTHIEVVERLGDVTLLACRLETGRTHQIRIHLSEAGHPVCGDPKYGDATRPVRVEPPRLALHAAELGFVHPSTQQPLHFEMPLPKDFARYLERLRADD